MTHGSEYLKNINYDYKVRGLCCCDVHTQFHKNPSIGFMALVLTEQRYGHYGNMCVVFLIA